MSGLSLPRVSVVIPAFNAERTLAATIASVQSQSLSDWDLVVVDDGSQDGTADLVRRLMAQDRRLQLIVSANKGVSAARNLGVARSHGPVVAFLDADDLWRADKLERHLDHLSRRPEVGVSFARVQFLTPAGEPSGQLSRARLRNLEAQHFLAENPTTTTSNWVVRRRVLEEAGGFCEAMSYCEDLEWLLRVRCCTGWAIEGLNTVLTSYRTSVGGLSADLERMEAGWETMLAKARTYAPELVKRHEDRARAIHLRYLARRSLRLGSASAQGVDFMARALRSDPGLLLRQPRRTWPTWGAVQLRRWRNRARTAAAGGGQP